MINLRLKCVVDAALKDVGVPLGNGNDVSYYCPFCKHHKRKLEVNLNVDDPAFGNYSCWVCKNRHNSSGTNLLTLFRKIGASSNCSDELTSLLQSMKLRNYDTLLTPITHTLAPRKELPFECISLADKRNDPEFKNAYHYVTIKRKCSPGDIIRYNLGYCDIGEYAGKIIIPSYDAQGDLNFFTARSYYDEKFGRHQNPNWTEDIIGFELFINWQLPIILVEGGFDAITARRNTIPLFGKNISVILQKKILENKVKEIFVALDADAIKDLIPIAELLMGYGINTHIVRLPIDHDPNKLGFAKFMQLCNDSKPATFKDLIRYKMGV